MIHVPLLVLEHLQLAPQGPGLPLEPLGRLFPHLDPLLLLLPHDDHLLLLLVGVLLLLLVLVLLVLLVTTLLEEPTLGLARLAEPLAHLELHADEEGLVLLELGELALRVLDLLAELLLAARVALGVLLDRGEGLGVIRLGECSGGQVGATVESGLLRVVFQVFVGISLFLLLS